LAINKIPDHFGTKRLFILDLDGTFSLDGVPFPKAIELIQLFESRNQFYVFLTNNSSNSQKTYYQSLRRMGLPVQQDHVVTSNQLAGWYILDQYPQKTMIYLGTQDGAEELKGMGLDLVLPYDRFREIPVDLALLAYDNGITYEKMKNFALALRKDIPYLATHPDFNYPSKQGLLPDCGSYIALFHASTGKTPNRIFGKPEFDTYRFLLQKKGISPGEALIIGDRLYTDIAGGVQAGIETLLVLSGETQEKDLVSSDIQPTWVVDSVGQFYDWLLTFPKGSPET